MTAASEIHEVAAGLFVWQAYEEEVKAELTSCAITTGSGLVLIDPIPLAPYAMQELLEAGQPVQIVLTSGNHERAAESLRDRFQIPVAASADAAKELSFKPDALITGGDEIEAALTVHEVPGGGPGEIALHHRAGVLHLGDALINFEPNGFAFLPDKYCSSPHQLRRSLRNLLPLEFSVLTFAHGLPLVTRAHERFAQLLA
jgi:hypothetical protein